MFDRSVRKNGHSSLMRLSKSVLSLGAFFAKPLHGRSKSIPARQGDARLTPRKPPGDGAKVFDAMRAPARRRARAYVQLGDFCDRGGCEEELVELRHVIDESAIGFHASFRKLCSGFQKLIGDRPVRREQRRFDRRRRQRLQVAARDLRMRIFRGDHLALLRHADLAVHRARWLGEDRLIARAAATPHRAAAAMEQAQLDATLLLDEFRKRDGSAINFPVAREKTAVLVAVRVAEHDLLHASGRLTMSWMPGSA